MASSAGVEHSPNRRSQKTTSLRVKRQNESYKSLSFNDNQNTSKSKPHISQHNLDSAMSKVVKKAESDKRIGSPNGKKVDWTNERSTLRLIRKWLRAIIQINGKLHNRCKGLPQEDWMHLKSKGLIDSNETNRLRVGWLESIALKYSAGSTGQVFINSGIGNIHYADDFSIYTMSKAEARRICSEVFVFFETYWDSKSIGQKME